MPDTLLRKVSVSWVPVGAKTCLKSPQRRPHWMLDCDKWDHIFMIFLVFSNTANNCSWCVVVVFWGGRVALGPVGSGGSEGLWGLGGLRACGVWGPVGSGGLWELEACGI